MKRSTKIRILRQGASMLFYPAALPLSAQTLIYAARVVRRHRKKIGSAWRKLNPGRQALLMLAYLRNGETFANLAAGVRHRHRDRLALCHRDRGPAGRPFAEAAPNRQLQPRALLPSQPQRIDQHPKRARHTDADPPRLIATDPRRA